MLCMPTSPVDALESPYHYYFGFGQRLSSRKPFGVAGIALVMWELCLAVDSFISYDMLIHSFCHLLDL